MKKIISAITALAICLALAGCSGAPENKHRFEGLEFVCTERDYVSNLKNFDDIVLLSDLIVVGEFIDDASVYYEEYEYKDFFGKDVLTDIMSSCPMKITKVLYGNAKEGDVLNIVQREGIWEDKFVSRSPLTPMQKGDEWIFCLKHTTEKYDHCEDSFKCVAGSWGRYPTNNVGSNERMCFSDHPDLGVYEESDFNQKFYNELVEKYGI